MRAVAQNSINIEIGGAGGTFWLTTLSAHGRLFIPTQNKKKEVADTYRVKNYIFTLFGVPFDERFL